jgi:HTH-type transcriptional regulator / antitoxin MqsA
MAAAKEVALLTTMPSPETGETLTRGMRPFKVEYKATGALSRYLDTARRGPARECMSDVTWATSIWHCGSWRNRSMPQTICKVRTKLGLSQRRAGAPFRVGPSVFDKYERGLIEPSGPQFSLSLSSIGTPSS